MQFSCTKKVVDKLKGIRSVAKEKWDAGFYNWYIDLVRIERKTYFLYTHSTTLFSFFVKAGPKTTLKSMETSFFEKMKEVVLQEIGANAAYVELLMAERASFEYGLTNSRAILGSMTDLKWQLEVLLDHYHGNLWTQIEAQVHHQLNRAPMKMIDHAGPTKAMRTALDQRL